MEVGWAGGCGESFGCFSNRRTIVGEVASNSAGATHRPQRRALRHRARLGPQHPPRPNCPPSLGEKREKHDLGVLLYRCWSSHRGLGGSLFRQHTCCVAVLPRSQLPLVVRPRANGHRAITATTTIPTASPVLNLPDPSLPRCTPPTAHLRLHPSLATARPHQLHI